MLKQTREKDLALFSTVAREKRHSSPSELPLKVVVPAFAISELKTAFEIGFLIYLPFLVIDLVVSSILLSMGMMMLPPVLISLPFKLLLFVLVDGWNLIVGSHCKEFPMTVDMVKELSAEVFKTILFVSGPVAACQHACRTGYQPFPGCNADSGIYPDLCTKDNRCVSVPVYLFSMDSKGTDNLHNEHNRKDTDIHKMKRTSMNSIPKVTTGRFVEDCK